MIAYLEGLRNLNWNRFWPHWKAALIWWQDGRWCCVWNSQEQQLWLTVYPHKICIYNHIAFRTESCRASIDTPLHIPCFFFLFLHLYFPFTALQYADFNIGICGWLLVLLSLILTVITLPLSIWICIKVSIRLTSLFIFSLQGMLIQGIDDGISILTESRNVWFFLYRVTCRTFTWLITSVVVLEFNNPFLLYPDKLKHVFV